MTLTPPEYEHGDAYGDKTATLSMTRTATPSPANTSTATPTASRTITATPSRTPSPSPSPTTVTGLVAACGTAFNMDGQLTESDWTTVGTWQNIANVTVPTNTMSATGKFKTYWDANNLYIGVAITKSPATLYSGTAGSL